jgi:hypothetical protein
LWKNSQQGCNLYCKYDIFALHLKSSKDLIMKKIATLFVSLATVFFAGAQGTIAPQDDILQLKQTEHDFGQIAQGKPVYYNFTIINTGKEPLKLDNVSASCGCTTPEWSKEPIAPGASASIRVGYNAAAEGAFDKAIAITYNTSQQKTLKIKGTVWKAPEGSAPANASVEFLKKQTQ